MRFLTRAILIVAAIAFATAANAQAPRPGGPKPGGGGGGGGGGGNSAMVNGFNPDQIAQIFTAAGFKSQVVETDDKVKVVLTQFWPDLKGISVGLACDKDQRDQCGAMSTFTILGKVDVANPQWLAAWNARYNFVRAWLNKSGDLIFQSDMWLINVSAEDVATSGKAFKLIVDQSTDFKP